MAITRQERRRHYSLTEGTWEEVTNRKLSFYFLRGRIIISPELSRSVQTASVP